MSRPKLELSPDHKYTMGGVMVPGVSEVLDIIAPPSFGGITGEYLAYRADIGSEAHEVTTLDDDGLLEDATVSEEIRPYLVAWRKFKQDKLFIPSGIELRVYSSAHRYAGTLDRRGTVNGRPAIVDIKTGAVDLARVGPQTAAYEQADREEQGIRAKRDRFAVQLRADGSYKLIPCKDPNDLNIFLYGLQIWNWRHVKHGSY